MKELKWSNPWYIDESRATKIAQDFINKHPKTRKDRFHRYMVAATGAFSYEDATYLWKKLKST